MDIRIRPVASNDIKPVVYLSLLAWLPVFKSLESVLGPTIYNFIWPDWKASQREAIEKVCNDGDETIVWVAELNGSIVGFIAYKLHTKDNTGEVWFLAVHPEHQNRGIATELNTFALARMKEAGMAMAKVETGGDSGHAPARTSYEKAGYTGLPLVRYFKAL